MARTVLLHYYWRGRTPLRAALKSDRSPVGIVRTVCAKSARHLRPTHSACRDQITSIPPTPLLNRLATPLLKSQPPIAPFQYQPSCGRSPSCRTARPHWRKVLLPRAKKSSASHRPAPPFQPPLANRRPASGSATLCPRSESPSLQPDWRRQRHPSRFASKAPRSVEVHA